MTVDPSIPLPPTAGKLSFSLRPLCLLCPLWLNHLSIVFLFLFLAGCARSTDPGRTPEQWRAALQPPLSAEQAAALATSPTLRLALESALKRSPALEAARERWRAAIERLPQETSLPDPMLEVKTEVKNLGALSDPMNWKIGVTQTLPWWSKLRLAGKIAASEAGIARLRYETAALDLLTDVKDAWYELYYLDQALPITERVEALLRNEGTLAYGQSAVGRAALGEAFRAESQAAQLGYDRLLLADQRVAQAERLRALLNLPPGTAIGPARAAPLYSVEQDLDKLYARAEAWAQALKISGLEIEQAVYQARLARLARVPDVSLGLEWMNTRAAGMNGGWSASDAPMLGMNLPIWEQRNRALIREKEALRKAAGLDALDQANTVRQAVAEAWFKARLTGRLAELYQTTLLPQAESVMRQAETWYRADQGSFSNVLETTLAWHNFLLAGRRAEADHGQAIDALERVLGTTAMPAVEAGTEAAR